ncbi:hypothetical protein M951_chr2172 (nucleomorph) [Lotharella oceanica]|uniref:Uncharacterized protein n=1 Tax=Lotharella oceanica TaxID=641309 RepID=A0A060DAQ6_9EUKA|nr:hypothetical protein M951_chr1178 [Lotharella oceanica]AIB09752.1 hypothetical protein M951_chr249 [Lotharella oceanica]AIB09864.1 hypothetical protein M951_chr2172 [Lotharella oceanica]|mmetsp:Transcript_4459/g.8935  ORF Transcript_4459/g.8935 Transcript_4459/m.8935 type:complete len:151 (-) Transcript_4459:154-606(-)
MHSILDINTHEHDNKIKNRYTKPRDFYNNNTPLLPKKTIIYKILIIIIKNTFLKLLFSLFYKLLYIELKDMRKYHANHVYLIYFRIKIYDISNIVKILIFYYKFIFLKFYQGNRIRPILHTGHAPKMSRAIRNLCEINYFFHFDHLYRHA